MPTVTLTLNGSAITGLTSNPSKVYTLSDADLQSILTWGQSAFASSLPSSPAVPTNPQILLAWIQSWVNGTRDAVQTNNKTIQLPTPISMS